MNELNRGEGMFKSFWLPLSAALGTMVLLYVIGNLGSIEFLMFKLSPSHTEIALFPIVAGFGVAIVSDRIHKVRSRD